MNDSEKTKSLNSLKNKKLFLATWACGDKDIYQCRDWIPFFEKMFGKVIVLPIRNYYYFYGREKLNERFLDILREEKPDYLLFGQRYNEIDVGTIRKIKEISPQTKTIIEHGDDDYRFDDWGRYYALFFDYIITTKLETEIYTKDKINRAVFLHGINPNFFRKMDVKKEYDVTFIGRPTADRPEYLKFLKENGVNITLFGGGWEKYSDLQNIYQGVLYNEDFPKIINQSKINLNFSKTLYKKGASGQLKSRIFEVPSCGSFMLNEFTTTNIEFINNTKEINFKTKEELLEKINYYLNHEKERENIAKKVQKYIVKHYSWESLLSEFFKKIDKERLHTYNLPNVNKKITKISLEELNKSMADLNPILKDSDYIFFDKGDCQSLSDREYFQAYSLFISKKQVSCCDYYSNSRLLGDYLIFKSKNAFNTLGNNFYQYLHIGQLMVTKEYFLENFDFFRQLSLGKFHSNSPTKIIKDEDIIFVSIPLVRINKFFKIKTSQIKENFYTPLFDKLFPLIHDKKFFDPYIFKFLLFSLMGNSFALEYLFNRFSLLFKGNFMESLGLSAEKSPKST
jgi:hypothetical protein